MHYEFYTQTDVSSKQLKIAINNFVEHCLPNEIVELCLEFIGDSIIVWNRKLYQDKQDVSKITYDEAICNEDITIKYEERDPTNAAIIETDEKSSEHGICCYICCIMCMVIFATMMSIWYLMDLKLILSYLAIAVLIGYIIVCCVTGFKYHYDKLCGSGSYYLHVEMQPDLLPNMNDISITKNGDLVNNSD